MPRNTQTQAYNTYAVNFRDANVDNSFSQVLGQVVVNTLSTDFEEIILQAIPYMPYYTTVIQITYLQLTPYVKYESKFYQIGNGEIKEVNLEEQWEQFRKVEAQKYKRTIEARPYGSRVLKEIVPSLAELKETQMS